MHRKNWTRYLEIRSTGYIGAIVDCRCGWIGKESETVEIPDNDQKNDTAQGCPDCKQPIQSKFI